MSKTIHSLVTVPAAFILALGLSACQNQETTTATQDSTQSQASQEADDRSSDGGADLQQRSSDPSEEATTEAASEESTAHATELKVGDCIKDMSAGSVTDVTLVDCDQPHLQEVYYNHEITASTLPTGSSMDEEVANACAAPFADYVGISYDQTQKYEVFTLQPSEDTWARGDRTITCMVTSKDGVTELTGSARGDAQ